MTDEQLEKATRLAKEGKFESIMIIADAVTEHQLPENGVCDSTLWASCIGGAGQEDTYKNSIEKSGMEVLTGTYLK